MTTKKNTLLLECHELGKQFTRGSREFWALKGANLTLNKGEFVTLLGKSGAGKSTLLTLLVGLQDPTEGTVRLKGEDLFSVKDDERSARRNAIVGYVPQGAGMIESLSVIDNVRLPWHLTGGRGEEPEGRALALLDAFGLKALANEMPKNLSGGELRRVSIARALMNDPEVIIADEPTASLDGASAQTVMEHFRQLADKGIGVLVVTHDTNFLHLSDRILDIEAGSISAHPAQ